MKDLAKLGVLVALSGALFGGLYSLAGGSVDQLLGSQSTVGGCSTVGGQSGVGAQSGVGGQSTVGGQSNVCKTPSTPFVSNVPTTAVYHGGFVAVVKTNGDGTKYVTSNTPHVCTTGSQQLTVGFVGVGTCSLTAHVTAGATYGAADGKAQSFTVGKATPHTPTIGNLPKTPLAGGSFTARVVSNSAGAKSVTPKTTTICTLAANKLTVTFTAAGQCTLVAHVASSRDYLAASGAPQSVTVSP